MKSPRFLLFALVIAASVAAAACSSAADEPLPPAQATTVPATPTPAADALRGMAEGRYLPSMTPALAEAIRAQPWFQDMSQHHLSLIAAVLETERDAGPRGERESVLAAFDYAAGQPWYLDGLDEREARGLKAVFQAYAESLSDWRAPSVGPVLASTLEYELFSVLDLAEGEDVVILVSSDDPSLGRQALDLAREWLPEVVAITGPFPYPFLHLAVTDLPELYAGLSYDEFIALAPDSVTAPVVIHELSHSTLYGIFPTWFEEGFAHFMEYHLVGALDEGVAYFEEHLAYFDVDRRLNIGPRPGYEFTDHMIDRATGFLFLKGLYDVYGVEEVVETIRSLRTRTFTDQELVRKLVDTSDPAQRTALRAFVCAAVIGTTHNYCD